MKVGCFVDNRTSVTSLGVASSGECLRVEGLVSLVWLTRAVVYLLAAAWAVDRPHSAAAPLFLANQLPLQRL